MQMCVSTPIATLTTRIRRCGTRPDSPPETDVAASEPIAPYPGATPQAILCSLKSHSLITASVPPATYSKRPYRNRPGPICRAPSCLVSRGGHDRVLTFIVTDPGNSVPVLYPLVLFVHRLGIRRVVGALLAQFGWDLDGSIRRRKCSRTAFTMRSKGSTSPHEMGLHSLRMIQGCPGG